MLAMTDSFGRQVDVALRLRLNAFMIRARRDISYAVEK